MKYITDNIKTKRLTFINLADAFTNAEQHE